jgi:hypothetical protein
MPARLSGTGVQSRMPLLTAMFLALSGRFTLTARYSEHTYFAVPAGFHIVSLHKIKYMFLLKLLTIFIVHFDRVRV